jgi:multimeric flavodoxin WrbA
MTRILAINGSYRPDGAIDQAVAVAVAAARRAGAEVEVVHLRDTPIEFCQNCRACTQVRGETPGVCVQHDGMADLVAKIEAADAYILASPTNFYSVTALFKRFMERLVVYAYWPWGQPAPKFRKPAGKAALLIASSAAPGIMGRLFYATMKQLRDTAKTIGAKPQGSVFIGFMSGQAQPVPGARAKARLDRLAARLAEAAARARA